MYPIRSVVRWTDSDNNNLYKLGADHCSKHSCI
ncbi:hypothetical protein TSAR_002088 [Trichomalopsis sarcophagae]|uniref:Uncharacterized protein n=1 Tax=Trichomalopsis sarcophagae TaxID=543379 RepID=A0A232EDT2_9HYME|nr:hypothetical protein TSAR_002088 [Trichomalopsis sarcophagae]